MAGTAQSAVRPTAGSAPMREEVTLQTTSAIERDAELPADLGAAV